MATLKAFDHLLHDIVRGKRISQSKMDQISEMTMQLVQNDTNLVAGLYKAHMAAKDSPQKINSLYVFDNIARAARSAAKKNNQSIKELAPDKPGNAGSLLFKMQGILDSIIQDMVLLAAQEPMEKALKVIRIWVKAKTFPSAVLSPLEQSVESALQGLKEPGPGESTEPSASTSDSDQPKFPASLLALLGAATQINPQSGSQTPNMPGTSSGDAQNASIALLQQLAAHNQAIGAGPPSSVSFDPHRQNYDSYATGPPYNMAGSSLDQGSRRTYGNDRSRFSPPGRDSNGRSDWIEGRRRNSRSQSPPPRVINTRDPRLAGTTNNAGASSSVHRDHNSIVSNPVSTNTGNESSEGKGLVGGYEQGAKTVSPVTAQSDPEIGASTGVAGSGGGAGGGSGSLESYDLSSFDTTSPEAWKRLSEAFIVTHARAPTQEELMNFVASRTIATAQPIPSLVTQQHSFQRMAFIPDPPRQIIAWETRELDELKRGPSLRHLGHGSYDSLGLGHVGYGPERTDHTDAIVLCGSLETST